MIQATREVIPFAVSVGKPTLVSSHKVKFKQSLIIGLIGDFRGRLIIDIREKELKEFAVHMFGMAVEGDMLTSFFGELGNILAGKLCTNLASGGVRLDITPPTVIQGSAVLKGFTKAISLPVSTGGSEELNMYITLSLE